MNTKMMKKHLEKCGIEFVKCEVNWEARMDGDLIIDHPLLGELVWKVAAELGED